MFACGEMQSMRPHSRASSSSRSAASRSATFCSTVPSFSSRRTHFIASRTSRRRTWYTSPKLPWPRNASTRQTGPGFLGCGMTEPDA